jgi:hypothetical protein
MGNTSAPLRFSGKELAEVQANGEGLDRLAAEPRSPPRIPAGTKPQNLGGSGPKQKPRRGDPTGFEVSQFGQPGDRGGPRAVQLAIYH